MGLKFTGALRLSTTSIVEHKGRSAITVLTVTVLFGVVMALNFLMNGIEKTAFEADVERTGGAVYIESGVQHAQRWTGEDLTTNQEAFQEFSDWTDENMIQDVGKLPDTFTPVISDQDYKRIEERAHEHHGEIVGATWYVQLDIPYYVVTLDTVNDFINVDLESVPEDKIPVLTFGQPTEFARDEELNAHLMNSLYTVGELPITQRYDDPDVPGRTVNWPVMPNGNLLNLLLRHIDGGLDCGFIIVDDGTGRIDKFMNSEVRRTLEERGWLSLSGLQRELVIKFTDINDAISYATPASFLGVAFYNVDDELFTADFMGGVVGTAGSFNALKAMLVLLEAVAVVVAVVIAVMTFRHLIAQEAATVALYRSMGASTGDIYLIYFLYILELILLSVVTCFVMAFAIVGVVALMNGAQLVALLQDYYYLPVEPKLYFYSFDQYFWTIIVAILLVAPLTLGFSSHCFGEKYIARKLKED